MPEWMHIPVFFITVLVMLIGMGGLVVPLFSGVVVIWLAALGYGLVAGFGTLGGWMFGIITVLMLVGVVIDNVLMGVQANREGASWKSILIALAAGVVGTIAFPPIGGLIAAPLAILLYERMRAGNWPDAINALRGLAMGFGLSYFVRLGIGVAMIMLWLIWAFNR